MRQNHLSSGPRPRNPSARSTGSVASGSEVTDNARRVVDEILGRLWRLLPRPWRLAVYAALKSFIYLMVPLRVGVGWRRAEPGGEPVTVLDLHGAVLGLGDAARLMASALERGGHRSDERTDVSKLLGLPAELPVAEDPIEASGVVISQINPPEMMWMLALTGARHLHGRRHIRLLGLGAAEAPASWRAAFAHARRGLGPVEFRRRGAPAHRRRVPIKAVGITGAHHDPPSGA